MTESVRTPGGTTLAVDIGTSGCRATLFDAGTRVIASLEQSYPCGMQLDTGYAEQDPDHLFSAFIAVVSGVCAGHHGKVRHVVLDSVLRSMVLLAADGKPLSPLSLWADTRATDQCAVLAAPYAEGRWRQKTGCPLSPSYPLARLLWYKEHHPGIFTTFAKAVSIKSYILYRLFSVFVEDHSVASASGLFNRDTLSWDDEIMSYLGIDATRLPTPVPVEYQLENFNTDFGSSGLPVGAVWMVGGGDGPMAHLGTAGDRPDSASLTIGTSSAVRMLGAGGLSGGRSDEWTYILDHGRHISGVASNVGGHLMERCLQTIVAWDGDWNALNDQLAAGAVESPLLFFPGRPHGRFPDDGLPGRGCFSTPPEGQSPETILRSVLEGIVFHTALLLRRFAAGRPLATIALSGSLTRLRLVRDMIAGVFGLPVIHVADLCAPQLGSLRLLDGRCIPMQEWCSGDSSRGYGDRFSLWCDAIRVHPDRLEHDQQYWLVT